MFRKKGSKILKLPPVRNCLTLAMTYKLVVIINSLKVPKIKKILLYEMKFLVQNYSCLQNPLLGGYRLQTPFLSVLFPQLNLLNPPRTKFLGTPLYRATNIQVYKCTGLQIIAIGEEGCMCHAQISCCAENMYSQNSCLHLYVLCKLLSSLKMTLQSTCRSYLRLV